MIKHKLFLKWWLLITIIVVSGFMLQYADMFSLLYERDATKLSFLLLGIFVLMSGWCGNKTWHVSKLVDSEHPKETLDKENVMERIDHLVEVGWFTSDLCLTIGMIGTVIGFIMMLSGFSEIDVSEVNTIQDLIKKLGVGMSTALYSTLTGLICSALLKIQYFNLNQAIDKLRR